MAALILQRYRQRRPLRRNRIFRNRTNPLHKFNDLELFWQFRFRRVDILQMTNELKEALEHLNRKGALPPVFTGRRTALNPCQQLTSIARQFPFFVCLKKKKLFCFFVLFLVLVVLLLFLVVFFVFFFSFSLSLCVKKSFFEYNWVSWPVLPSHLHSARPLFFFFFGCAGRKDWIIWRACVEALITGKPQKEFHHLKITDS